MSSLAEGRSTGALGVVRREPHARWFLLANVQSAVGTGAATVALVVLAYERLQSPWALTLVLQADFLPVMLLGPVIGAFVDRSSRRACAIVADLVRVVAFVGISVVHSFEATVALAVLAGVGTALFSPAILSSLPSLVEPERRAAVTSLYGATRDVGRTLGPLVAAIAFPLVGAGTLMIVNGATFAVSALVLALIPIGRRVTDTAGGGWGELLHEAREGLTATWQVEGVRVVLWASTAVIVFASMVNVGELLLAHDVGAGSSGFALLMAGCGAGVVAGSLTGARGGELPLLKRRYLAAILLVGTGTLALALVDAYWAALVAFVAMGFGNGVVVVHERLIFHAAIEDRLMGRAFALLDTLGGWGFAAAFVGAGALVAAIGTRGLFAVAGVGGVLVWVLAALALRRVWQRNRRASAAT